MERLLTGYQEDLITLEELLCRMPELRKQQVNEAELQSREMTAVGPTQIYVWWKASPSPAHDYAPETTSWK